MCVFTTCLLSVNLVIQTSHKNDVYSMGLVIWELIERRWAAFGFCLLIVFLSLLFRVVFSEYDGYGGFDYVRFQWNIFFQKLSHLQVPNCLGKMRDIVQ